MQVRSSAHSHDNKWRHKKCRLLLEDSINKLPDELLVSILSLLTIAEAGRTSVLSRRWEKLWKSFTGASIVFDDYWKPEVQPEAQHKFISRVNQVLTSLNESSSLDHFTVRSHVSKDSLCHIDKMVESALGKRVKRLELDMLPDKCLPLVHTPEKYTFPSIRQGLYYFKKIKQYHIRFSPRDLYRIAYLTSLCLKYVNVSDETIGNLISNCQFLEQISIDRSDELKNLVVRSAIRLKSLKISSCQFLYNVDISAPNLVFFHYSGTCIRFRVEKAHKLLEVSTNNHYLVGYNLSNYSSQLETLALDISFMSIWSFPCSFKLERLKSLTLRCRHSDVGLLEWTRLIERAFPLLSRLTIELQLLSNRPPREICKLNHRSRDGLPRSGCSTSTHPCLKVVEMIRFVGCATDIELVMHLLANSITLEKIIIDRRTPFSSRLPLEGETEEQIVAKNCAAKKCALRLIEEYLRPGADFVVI